MNVVHIKLTRGFTVENSPDLDAHTDSVMEELLALEDDQLCDADISVDFGRSAVEISIVAIGPDFDEAVERADSAIRSAIHAAGGSTRAWKNAKFTPEKSEADLIPA